MTIRELREKNNLTQEYMARNLNITLRHYVNIEKKLNEPSITTGLKIAKILKVDPYKLWAC